MPSTPSAPPGSSGPQVTDPTTRENILRVALDAFSLHGFDGASTRQIAAQAGVNQGLIPYYFRTKQALWREAVDRAFEELHDALGVLALRERPANREGIARLLRGYVSFVAAHPEFLRMMNEEGKRKGPRMRWLADRHVKPLMEGLADVLAQSAEEIGMPKGVHPAHLNYLIVGAVSMIFHQAPECRRVWDYDPSTPEAIEAHSDSLIHVLLGDATLGR